MSVYISMYKHTCVIASGCRVLNIENIAYTMYIVYRIYTYKYICTSLYILYNEQINYKCVTVVCSQYYAQLILIMIIAIP